MPKTPLYIRMMPYIRQEYLHNATCPAYPSITRAALSARKAQAITGVELGAIRKAWADCRADIDEHKQARAGQWEQYAAGIIHNAEAAI